MFLRNLSDFYVEIIRIFLEKHWKDLQGDSFFLFVLSSFLKIGLTVAALACLEYLFKYTSLLIILAKWQSIILADILTNFAKKPSGTLALFTFGDLIILLMSLVLAYGRSNAFFGTHTFFIFRMLGWLLYIEIISLTVTSSWDASEEFPSDKGFLPEDFSSIYIMFIK